MNKIINSFKIDAQSDIKVIFPKNINPHTQANIYNILLFHQGHRYDLAHGDYGGYIFDNLNFSLNEILNGNAVMDSSIDDIGIQWNKYLDCVDNKDSRDQFATYTNKFGSKTWVGLKYYLWEHVPTNSTSWLYETNGKILLELTPVYPWVFDDPVPGETFISYEEFIKNYKPILLLEIPRERIIEWQKQTARLAILGEKAEERWRQECCKQAHRRDRLWMVTRQKRACRR